MNRKQARCIVARHMISLFEAAPGDALNSLDLDGLSDKDLDRIWQAVDDIPTIAHKRFSCKNCEQHP